MHDHHWDVVTMNIEDIKIVQTLLNNLTVQVAKLNAIQNATNIHVQCNGPSQNMTHMNFSDSQSVVFDPDANQGEYNWDEMYDFIEAQLQKKITYLRTRLESYGVKVDG